MNTLSADLAEITGGMSVSHYANDDDNFVEAVAELVDLGHDRKAAEEALAKWIDDEPTWDCPNCALGNIEEAGWAYCPNCDEANPSVYTVTVHSPSGN